MAKAMRVDKLGFLGNAIGWIFIHITRINKLNKIYDRVKHLQGDAFFDALLREFNLKVEVQEEELKRIPKEGAFISISNHPLGGAEGIILLKILTELRPDFKVTANFLLQKIEPMASYVIAVNPFETLKKAMRGGEKALQHVADGNALGFFPAGEVSTKRENGIYVDREWSKGSIRIIQKSNVPVIPIYFHAQNSKLFYSLSKISGLLRTAKLPSELVNKRGKTIKMRIGKPIMPAEMQSYPDIKSLSSFLRQKTYLLSNAYLVKSNPIKSAKDKLKFNEKEAQPIIKPVEQSKIEREIEALMKADKRLFCSKNYEIYFTKSKEIPNILREIGRLREITFREVGEGSNLPVDLDRFDNHYHHLFLWDAEAKTIAGAYRMALGQEVFPKHGINGFYISSLFKFEPELYSMMQESIEMGRAFVVKSYQQKPMPLFLLWRGIVHVTLRYPEHKYLIGGVSISNKFSNFSKSLMIEFMKSHYYDPFIAQYIRPKKEYKVKLNDSDKDFVFDAAKADLNKFDRIITEIEPEGLRVPVLIKKYV